MVLPSWSVQEIIEWGKRHPDKEVVDFLPAPTDMQMTDLLEVLNLGVVAEDYVATYLTHIKATIGHRVDAAIHPDKDLEVQETGGRFLTIADHQALMILFKTFVIMEVSKPTLRLIMDEAVLEQMVRYVNVLTARVCDEAPANTREVRCAVLNDLGIVLDFLEDLLDKMSRGENANDECRLVQKDIVRCIGMTSDCAIRVLDVTARTVTNGLDAKVFSEFLDGLGDMDDKLQDVFADALMNTEVTKLCTAIILHKPLPKLKDLEALTNDLVRELTNIFSIRASQSRHRQTSTPNAIANALTEPLKWCVKVMKMAAGDKVTKNARDEALAGIVSSLKVVYGDYSQYVDAFVGYVSTGKVHSSARPDGMVDVSPVVRAFVKRFGEEGSTEDTGFSGNMPYVLVTVGGGGS
jgi:hypothetical protein